MCIVCHHLEISLFSIRTYLEYDKIIGTNPLYKATLLNSNTLFGGFDKNMPI